MVEHRDLNGPYGNCPLCNMESCQRFNGELTGTLDVIWGVNYQVGKRERRQEFKHYCKRAYEGNDHAKVVGRFWVLPK